MPLLIYGQYQETCQPVIFKNPCIFNDEMDFWEAGWEQNEESFRLDGTNSCFRGMRQAREDVWRGESLPEVSLCS